MKVILLIILVAVSACSQRVTPDEWAEVERVCKDHGGVSIYFNGPSWNQELVGDIKCKDGLVIKEHRINSEG